MRIQEGKVKCVWNLCISYNATIAASLFEVQTWLWFIKVFNLGQLPTKPLLPRLVFVLFLNWRGMFHLLFTYVVCFAQKKSLLISKSTDLVVFVLFFAFCFLLHLVMFPPINWNSAWFSDCRGALYLLKEITGGLTIIPDIYLPIHLPIRKGQKWRMASEIRLALRTKRSEKLIGLWNLHIYCRIGFCVAEFFLVF